MTPKIEITNEPCIYKITNPKKRVYIGQSVNFKSRLLLYKRKACFNQKKLLNSLIKYGFESHKIEILIICSKDELNELERYYQDLYSSNGPNGLNIRLTKASDRSGSFNEETKIKMRSAKVGKKMSEDVKRRISNKMKLVAAGRSKDSISKFLCANKGRVHSDEHRLKNSLNKKGNKFRSNHKKRTSNVEN